MEEDLIIKKIYINDYIINTTLLQNSISKLLINTLSSKFYKTNKIHQKVNNILTKIENIFIEDSSGNKIFNLSYQPYNQYNITNNYTNNLYNKKWILPIITEKKTLSQNVLKMQTFFKLLHHLSFFYYRNKEGKLSSSIPMVALKITSDD